ncbi:hypothetical protein ACFU8T_09090 [Sphingobacterium spiritivorum]|uniref:Outer membrane insertion signal domain protein n=1 Tax=Sphingobacterium spiritivorum ATCC 33861 TaxID=525373 RepID=D7VSF0_SPHSI|nr:hypothetical protein [Sphingobacterium spiritivorum]EFK56701.1 outer membrane insertion signal domain protein [Sphingobacterium spiritivorum ATCC 33861]QQT35260.1 hypothetical protein I6J01_18535 [Sphingobacterium spiritivorum]WQD36174.1 hypothetical protein U0038_10485 [Sphingobacterium spiritivorum]SUJ04377.1 PG33 [Sphingobacterium spiritivorum]
MRRKYSILLVSLLSVATQIYASTTDPVTITPKFQQRKNSPFYNPWFAGAGVGGQIYFGDHNKQLPFGKRITPNFDLYAGKWINANTGIRAGINGFQIKGLTQNGSHSTGEVYNAAERLQKQEFKYLYAHADILVNMNNVIDGYDNERIYSFVPYAGIGIMMTANEPKATKISPNLGVLNTFVLTENLHFTADVRGNFVGDSFDGEVGGRRGEGTLTVSLGVSYTFKKRTFYNWR